jgi:hypothetical protein
MSNNVSEFALSSLAPCGCGPSLFDAAIKAINIANSRNDGREVVEALTSALLFQDSPKGGAFSPLRLDQVVAHLDRPMRFEGKDLVLRTRAD